MTELSAETSARFPDLVNAMPGLDGGQKHISVVLEAIAAAIRREVAQETARCIASAHADMQSIGSGLETRLGAQVEAAETRIQVDMDALQAEQESRRGSWRRMPGGRRSRAPGQAAVREHEDQASRSVTPRRNGKPEE